MAIDNAKLDQLIQKGLIDFGATFNAALIVVGDKLGLYKVMAGAGPMTSAELAERARIAERYAREWLAGQSAGGYIDYDSRTGRYTLSEEQSLLLADENGPAFLPGCFESAVAAIKAEPKITEAFRTGAGVGWHEHDPGLFRGTERFFRTGYAANLVSSWIPALDDMEEKLKCGAHVADVGCGHGASTILMTQAYPNSTFIGFDYHEPSILTARARAAAVGVSDRLSFEVAKAKDYPGKGYDLVTFFDCLHDLGDPVGAAAHVLETLDADGTWMIVEPRADDRVEQNLNPIGRIFYCASTFICTPASLSQEVGLALGAQAGEARLSDVVMKGGFTRFRRATETPFNMILEARP